MDFLIIIVLLVILMVVPSFIMQRKQRQHQEQMATMQSELEPGDCIITGAGFHGRVVALGESTVDIELAPGTIVTMERIAVLRNVTKENAQ